VSSGLSVSVVISVLMTLILSVVSFGDLIWQPNWGAMLVIFWCLHYASSLSLGAAFILGILMDGVAGTLIGSHALSFCIIAYVTTLVNHRLAMFTWVQRAMFVFILVGIGQILLNWTLALRGESLGSLNYLNAALTSAVVWPFWSAVLKSFYPRREIND
jgi:rod shape-determining protein MreD